jgi:hypothetical protein
VILVVVTPVTRFISLILADIPLAMNASCKGAGSKVFKALLKISQSLLIAC